MSYKIQITSCIYLILNLFTKSIKIALFSRRKFKPGIHFNTVCWVIYLKIMYLVLFITMSCCIIYFLIEWYHFVGVLSLPRIFHLCKVAHWMINNCKESQKVITSKGVGLIALIKNVKKNYYLWQYWALTFCHSNQTKSYIIFLIHHSAYIVKAGLFLLIKRRLFYINFTALHKAIL